LTPKSFMWTVSQNCPTHEIRLEKVGEFLYRCRLMTIGSLRVLHVMLVAAVINCAKASSSNLDAASEGDVNPEPDAAPIDESLVQAPDIRWQDVAIAFELTSTELIGFTSDVAGQRLFPSNWYDAVVNAFLRTDVEDALDQENLAADWKLMSMRIAPCAPLGPTPASDVERVCWPEIRLVFQPILRNVRIHERTSEGFADDRAIHAIYPVPANVLSASDATTAVPLLAKIRNYAKAYAGGAFAPLTTAELAAFGVIRDKASRQVVIAARGLRGAGYALSAFDVPGVRPESNDTVANQRMLRTRTLSLLSNYARPAALAELTAFSLPEGREPAALDTWVFIAFRNVNGRLTTAPLTVRSPSHGGKLLDLGSAETVATATGDVRTQAALNAAGANPELRDTVIGNRADLMRLSPILSDRSRRLVPNTTCASCHMANSLRFDFHNFGYLEDRELTISPRVRRDVELDLVIAKRVLRAAP
jgi:hypothetical protein